jgi:hypothetical protein
MGTALELLLDGLQWAWEHNANIFQWIWANKRAVGEGVLVLSLVLLGWRYNSDRAQLHKQIEEAQGLAAGIGLQLKITQNQLEITRRDSTGKVTYRNIYVAPEGYVMVDQKEQSALQQQLGDLTDKLKAATKAGNTKEANGIQKQIDQINPGLAIKVVDHGWTFKPGYGADWANHGTKVRLDFKYFYWGRYGLIAGGGPNGFGPGVSRHIDDVIWGRPANVEVFAQFNALRFQSGTLQYTVGLRSNF